MNRYYMMGTLLAIWGEKNQEAHSWMRKEDTKIIVTLCG